ncbi:hypothetical protein SNE40_000462 [Patella caerulea]|uniref:CUB domain-containing protein n=1 Tax=Patella caerulea TaxID=87958 RepID=A0AAN8KGM3_PATCE
MFTKILVLALIAHVVLGNHIDTKDEQQKPRFKRSSCGVSQRRIGDMTEIKYPASGNYQNYARCDWHYCPGTTRVQVTVTKMDIEPQSTCQYDALIIDNNRYCGTSLRILDVYTNGGCITVAFTSDGSVQMSGFHVEIRPITDNYPSYSSEAYPIYSSHYYPSYSSHYYPSYSSDPYPSYSSHYYPSYSSDPYPSYSSDPYPSYSSNYYPSYSPDPYPSYSSHYYPSYSSDPYPSYSSHYYPSYSSDPYPSYSSHYYPSYSSDPYPSYSSHYYPSYSSDPYTSYSSHYYPSYSSSYYPDSSQVVYNSNSSSGHGMVGVLHHAQDTLQDAQETVDAIEEELQLK